MIYNLIRVLLYVPLGIAMIFSSKLRKFVTKRVFQKVKLNNNKDVIWIHCASVGEVNLAEPIINKVLEETKDNLLITMVTDTGRATAENKYKSNSRVNILFFPLDDYFAIRKILKKISLKKLIIVETEIWPNLIKLSAKKSKVMMINGRISNKSIKSYSKIRRVLRKLFKDIEIFIMQTEKDKKRIIFLGAKKEKVFNYGNLKFNIELPNYGKEELEKLKEKLNPENKNIWVAGSTRDNEEEFILKAFDKLQDTLLILVPRHIERTDDICSRLLEKYNYVRYSELGNYTSLKGKNIIIVDKIGELRRLYAVADVAYVGGTLVDIGGHSLLEPLFYRKIPIFGPYTQNVKDIAREILAKKIGYQVHDENELFSAVNNTIVSKGNNEKTLKGKEEKVDRFFKENSHVVELTFEKVKN